MVDVYKRQANISNANISNANISNANILNANISNANILNANILNVNISNTNIMCKYNMRNDIGCKFLYDKISVSYTHLDVYKRQGNSSTEDSYRGLQNRRYHV